MLSTFGIFSPEWLQASVEPGGNMSAFLVCLCNTITLAPGCLQEIPIQQWPRVWSSFSLGRPCRQVLSQVQVTPAHPGLCPQAVAVVRDEGVRRTWRHKGPWLKALYLAVLKHFPIHISARDSTACKSASSMGWLSPVVQLPARKGCAEQSSLVQGVSSRESRSWPVNLSSSQLLHIHQPRHTSPISTEGSSKETSQEPRGVWVQMHSPLCAVQCRRCSSSFITYLGRRFPWCQAFAAPTHYNQ